VHIIEKNLKNTKNKWKKQVKRDEIRKGERGRGEIGSLAAAPLSLLN
jgi:hypothetical protein